MTQCLSPTERPCSAWRFHVKLTQPLELGLNQEKSLLLRDQCITMQIQGAYMRCHEDMPCLSQMPQWYHTTQYLRAAPDGALQTSCDYKSMFQGSLIPRDPPTDWSV